MEDLRESFQKMQLTPGQRGEDGPKGKKVNPGDKISISGLDETVLWSDLDMWTDGSPQKCDHYTLLDLQETFILILIVLSILHFIGIIIVKSHKSKDVREEEHKTKKNLHNLENLN